VRKNIGKLKKALSCILKFFTKKKQQSNQPWRVCLAETHSGCVYMMNAIHVCQRASPVFLLNSQSAALHMQRPTMLRHDRRFCNAITSASGRAQSLSARTAGMHRVIMCVAVISVHVRFAAIKSFVNTQTAFRVFQRASLVLLRHFLSAASYMQNQTQFRHGRRFCHQITSACSHVLGPSARTAGMQRVMMCAAVTSADVRFAAIKSFVKTQTAFRVFQRASPAHQHYL
jgi:hypothetical protein